MMQLKLVDPQNTLAQQIIAEHLKLLQNNQLKEVARAVNRPVELGKARRGRNQAARSETGLALQQDRSRDWLSRTCNSAKWMASGKLS